MGYVNVKTEIYSNRSKQASKGVSAYLSHPKNK
jgi:hypothetical protein